MGLFTLYIQYEIECLSLNNAWLSVGLYSKEGPMFLFANKQDILQGFHMGWVIFKLKL